MADNRLPATGLGCHWGLSDQESPRPRHVFQWWSAEVKIGAEDKMGTRANKQPNKGKESTRELHSSFSLGFFSRKLTFPLSVVRFSSEIKENGQPWRHVFHRQSSRPQNPVSWQPTTSELVKVEPLLSTCRPINSCQQMTRHLIYKAANGVARGYQTSSLSLPLWPWSWHIVFSVSTCRLATTHMVQRSPLRLQLQI